jgi:plastocyanin
MKKIITVLIFVLLLVGIAACSSPGTTSQTNRSTGIVEVHTSSQTFVPSSVTIEKGQGLTLVNDSAVLHPIENGTWQNGTATPLQETGAPTVKVQLSGQDRQTIGPFTSAGTYQLYCTAHPGMNLTVVVQ